MVGQPGVELRGIAERTHLGAVLAGLGGHEAGYSAAAMVAPSPIIITPPVTLSVSSRWGRRANQSRARAAARAQMLSEATHMAPNTSPRTASWTPVCPAESLTNWGRK